MNPELFREILKMHRIGMGAGNRKKTEHPNITQTWLYPFQWEQSYYETISAMQDRFITPLEDKISVNLERWISEYRYDSKVHNDTFSSELEEAVQEAEAEANTTYVEKASILLAYLSTLGGNASTFNLKQSQKFFMPLLGMPWTPEELWVDEVIAAWGNVNYNLVKSLTTEGIKNMNTLVSEGVAFGRTYTEIMEDLYKKNSQITTSRSKLIARDQIGKLNGMLSQRRMQETGINLYKWSTALDERVRGNPNGTKPKANPSHYIMEGILCRWDDSTVYSVNAGKTWKKRKSKMTKSIPGQDIQCRCTGLPYFDNIIGDVDAEINKELAI